MQPAGKRTGFSGYVGGFGWEKKGEKETYCRKAEDQEAGSFIS